MNDLIKIKKYYGENMMHLCRELFPTILEQENLLFSLLDNNFAHSKFLYEDIIENDMKNKFKEYIYSLLWIEKEQIEVTKTPKELMSDAGYILYECHTESDIQKFKKYYSKGEELCTFNGGRLDDCHVFFAVKKTVNEIKRENFPNPQREDEYGTSVISIQFSRGKINTLSIKNRYNHIVNNPDATFSNNLENIISGLTCAFEKDYNLDINQNNKYNFELLGYVKANDGKYYKYNHEINNIYYCPNNIIIDNFAVKKYEPEKYLVIDYFILDLVNKELYLYDELEEDSFINGLQLVKKIEINKSNQSKIIRIILNNNSEAYLEIDKYNRIISYKNDNLIEVGSNFLSSTEAVKKIELPNAKIIGDHFLEFNESLMEISLPKAEEIGDCFIYYNKKLKEINLSCVNKIGDNFLGLNESLTEINLQNTTEIGECFLEKNEVLKEINLPCAEKIGNCFLIKNEVLTEISLPKIEIIGKQFLYNNNCLTKINFPKLEIIGSSFLYYNEKLKEIDLPKVEIIGNSFLCYNRSLTKINLPKVQKIDGFFLIKNEVLTEISLPKVEIIGNHFLDRNNCLTEISFLNLKKIGDHFLSSNEKIQKINLPNVITIGDYFLTCSKKNLSDVKIKSKKFSK